MIQFAAGWFLIYFLFAPGKLFTVDSISAAATARQMLHGRLAIEENLLTLPGREGRLYLRHALLWSAVLVPFDGIALLFEKSLPEELLKKLFPNGPNSVVLPLSNHLVTSLILALLFQFLLALGVRQRIAFITASTAAMATLLLPYSRDLFRQPLAALLILGIVASLWDLRPGRAVSRSLLAGSLAGLAIVNRYATFGFLPAFFLGFAFRLYRPGIRIYWKKAIPAFLLPVLAGYGIHCFTLWLRWGNPFFNTATGRSFSASLFETVPYYFLSPEGGLLFYCPFWDHL